MTWPEALRHADVQIANWQTTGLGVGEAEEAISLVDLEGLRWQAVRQWLAAWAMLHRDVWED